MASTKDIGFSLGRYRCVVSCRDKDSGSAIASQYPPSCPGLTRLRGRSPFGAAKARASINLRKMRLFGWIAGSRLRQGFAGPSARPAKLLSEDGKPGNDEAELRRCRRHAAVDHDRLAGHEGRGIGSEIGDRAGDLVGLADAAERRGGTAALQPLLVLPQRAGEIGLDEAGRDAVDAHALGPPLAGKA